MSDAAERASIAWPRSNARRDSKRRTSARTLGVANSSYGVRCPLRYTTPFGVLAASSPIPKLRASARMWP